VGDAGRVVAVLRDGAVATLDVEGIANRDTGEPLTVDSIFYVGSLAKQFVAACILLLADDGALDLHDPVRAFVPEAPGWGDRVTLAHLAHHTSGLPPPPYDQDGFSPTGVPAYGNLERLARVLAIEALDREPGVAYGYTNHGYTLLAEVVARTHGASLASFARDRLFGPLGMTDTWFRDAPTPLPERAARGHFDANDGTVRVEPAVFHAVGAGGLWTTVADLATWDRAFDDDTTIVPRLTERGTLRDGTTIHYAWGLSVRSHRGLPIVSHGGNFPGWESKMVRFPSERTTVIVLANREDLDVSALALRTADVVLADAMDRSAPHADATFDGTG
jgi:CubicO group peptidase (beta-lactamase class C family)